MNKTCAHRDLLFGNIYDTFSSEDNLSKTVFLEHLCRIISAGKLSFLRTVIAKDFIGKLLVIVMKTKCHEFINCRALCSVGEVSAFGKLYTSIKSKVFGYSSGKIFLLSAH